MVKRNFYILSIVILFFLTVLGSVAKDKNNALPKTKDTGASDKKPSDDDSKDSVEDKNNSDAVEEEIKDPDQNFKLIAVYLIGSKPRALIKNLDKPEEAAREYQIGDFVDELQAFSVSKILLNPTVRIELTDSNGLSYLLKPKNAGNANNTLSKVSKSSPSYSSGYKTKIKRAVTNTGKPSDETSSASPAANAKPSDSASLEAAVKNDAASSPAGSGQTPLPQQQNTTSTSQTASTTTSTSSGSPQAAVPTQSNTPAPAQQNAAAPTQSNTVAPAQQNAAAQTQSNTAAPAQQNANVAPMGMTDYLMSGSGGSSNALDTSRPANPFGE